MSATTRPAQAKSSPETIAKIEALASSLERLMVQLAARWSDERDYEDIRQYQARIVTELETIGSDAKVCGMKTRPFGFKFTIGTPVVYLIYCCANGEYGWKRAYP
jgi:hypothetical protein